MKKAFATIGLILGLASSGWAQINPCPYGTGDSCTVAEGPPFSLTINQPADTWPYAQLGEEVSVTADLTTNLAGLLDVTTTNEDCSVTNYINPLGSGAGTGSVISNWWVASGTPYAGSGSGLTATFMPTAYGTGTLTFYVTYSNAAVCGGTNLVSLSTTYYVVSNAPPAENMLDINVGGNPPTKTGFAAVGMTTNDYWNEYGWPFRYNSFGYITNLAWVDGVLSGAGLEMTNAYGIWGWSPVPYDNMYANYMYGFGSDVYAVVTNLPSGTYSFYVYAHGNEANQNGSVSLICGGVNYGTQSTASSGTTWQTTYWQQNQQYVIFSGVAVTNPSPVLITIANTNGGYYTCLNGIQIVQESGYSVGTLMPTNNTNVTLVCSNATSQTYTIPVSTNPATLEIVGTPSPYLPPQDLPEGWSLDGMRTNITYISLTNSGTYTIVCGVGASVVTNVICVTGPGGNVHGTLHNFTSGDFDGAYPTSDLLLAGTTLYGTTQEGGSNNLGTIFKVNMDGTGFALLHSFTGGADGSEPKCGLILSGTNLYGTAQFGGSGEYVYGTVFSINTNGTVFTTIATFNWETNGVYDLPFGGWPMGELVLSGNTLYGTTYEGGTNDQGTIFKVNTDGSGFTNVYDLTNASEAGLVLSGNTLYGTMAGNIEYVPGYPNRVFPGTVFSVRTSGADYTNLHTFTTNDGTWSMAQLVLSGGTLYGTTQGASDAGPASVFSLGTNGSGYTILHSFDGTDGGQPLDRLLLSGGTLYGTTSEGGMNGYGTVFNVNTNGTDFESLYSFSAYDGDQPAAGLVISGDVLFGTTQYGGPLWSLTGSLGDGTVFSLEPCVCAGTGCVPGSATNCTSATGSPFAISVLEPSTGWPYSCAGETISVSAAFTTNLAGLADVVTSDDACFVVSVVAPLPTNSILSNWWSASGEAYTGSGPGSNAVFVPTGCGSGSLAFYLTYLTACGETNTVSMTNSYTVVSVAALAPTNNTNCTLVCSNATLQAYSIAVSTNPSTLEFVATPCPSLAATNLPACWSLDGVTTNVTYLTITNPGAYTVVCTVGTYSITNAIWVSCTGGSNLGEIYNFTATKGDGAGPDSDLLLVGTTLYGSALSGGSDDYGTIFKVNIDGTGQATLYSFTGSTDGEYPQSDLVEWEGYLYGVTYGGGYGYGSIFRVSTNGGSFATVHAFVGSDGAYPYGGLLLSGNELYGTASYGGYYGDGTVFKVTTVNSGFTTLWNFTGTYDGTDPVSRLILSGGTLYGTTAGTEGSVFGTVYKINTNGAGYATLHTFSDSDGSASIAGLVISGSTLYGSSTGDYSAHFGTVFAIQTNASGFTTLHAFNNSDGVAPSQLWLSGPALYGMTFEGGSYGDGTIFQIYEDGSGFATLYDFTGGNDGYNPLAGLTILGDTLYGATASGGLYENGTVFAYGVCACLGVGTAPCESSVTTNCTTATGAPFTLSIGEPSSGWPYVCEGGQVSVSTALTTNLAGLEQVITTNDDCTFSSVVSPLPTNSIVTNWWVASGEAFSGSGGGTNAVFTPTNCGTGNIVFCMTYLTACGQTNTAAMTNTYEAVGVIGLAPTNNTNCTLVCSNATSQTYSILVSTNPSTLEIVATSCPGISATNLPPCWSLDGVTTNITYVSLTNSAVYTVVCSAGASAITNIICVTVPGGVAVTDDHDFTNGDFDGAYPISDLVLVGATLYGTTQEGGSNDFGTIFKVNTDGSGFAVLHSFTGGADGSEPRCGLILSGTNLYGTAQFGGSGEYVYGTVFSINTNGTVFTTIATFNWETNGVYDLPFGGWPMGELVLSGNTLYGTTYEGGASDEGTIFKVNTDGSGFTNVYDLTNASEAGLVLSGGTLYGTMAGVIDDGPGPIRVYPGTVFSVTTNGADYTNLHTFTTNDGTWSAAQLVLSGGTLYGMAQGPPHGGPATVFSLGTNGSGYTIVHSFDGTDGGQPLGRLLLSGGVLYGTTSGGGTNGGYGTVFQVNTDGSGFESLHSFDAYDGDQPSAGLVLSGNALFGTTLYGGPGWTLTESLGDGTVFGLEICPCLGP